jgi:enamine deaminase RidA (YjgF/YER057c/UK114 family)
MVEKTIITPEGLAKPVGYNHAVAVSGGTTVYIAGQVAMDAEGDIVAPGDIVGQFERALGNLELAVQASGGHLTDIVKLNLYVTDVGGYWAEAKAIGEVYRAHFGTYYPAMTLLGVSELFHPEIMIEMDAVAVIATDTNHSTPD